jgi:hypothetical protein
LMCTLPSAFLDLNKNSLSLVYRCIAILAHVMFI